MMGAATTVIIAVALFTVPSILVTRTQKNVVTVSAPVSWVLLVAPSMRFNVSPLCPSYHW